MLKCRACFFTALPDAWISDRNHPKGGFLKPKEEQKEEARIALDQAKVAVTVFDGNALCLDHLVERFRGEKPKISC